MKRRRWRPLAWLIVIVNVFFAIVTIATVRAMIDDCNDGEVVCVFLLATGASVAIVAGLIAVWAGVDVVLGALWFATNRGRRFCASCRRRLEKGETSCPRCDSLRPVSTAPDA